MSKKLEEKVVNLKDLKSQYDILKSTKLAKSSTKTLNDQMYIKKADGSSTLKDFPDMDIATVEETIAYLRGELFALNYDIEHGSAVGPIYIIKDTEASFVITPDKDYNLPESGSDFRVENAIISDYIKETARVFVKNPTGNVLVAASCPIKTRTISVNISGGEYEGDRIIEYYGTASGKITPDAIHTLPTDIEVINAEYTYDSTTGDIVIFNATDDVIINVVCVLDEVLEFTTCEWGDLIARCQRLEAGKYTTDQFCQLFTIDGNTVNDIGDFIGTTRTVDYDGSVYNVVVLDVQHEELSSESGTYATMTFQFIDVVSSASEGTGETVQYAMDTHSNSWYDGSTQCNLRKWLTGEFINKLDAKVRDGIVNVNKATYDGMGTDTISVHEESVFVPALAEIASSNGIYNSGEATIRDYADTYVQEGAQYRYYAITLGDDDPADWSTTHETGVQVKYDMSGTAKNWWLRTPSKDNNTFAWSIRNGDADDRIITTNTFCVSPVFCI